MTYFPRPDRSNYTPVFKKTVDSPSVDIGWNEGLFADGRPYRVECWAEEQITMLTFFFSSLGMEQYSDRMMADFLSREGLIEKVLDLKNMSVQPVVDPSGNDLWSVNLVVGNEDGLILKDHISLKRYGEAVGE